MMKKAMKNEGKKVNVYRLGEDSKMETDLVSKGLIKPDEEPGYYRLVSTESVNGQGQKAKVGTYFKVDEEGNPYPQDTEKFLATHQHIDGDTWEQIPSQVGIYEDGDTDPEELEIIDWLVSNGKLTINPVDEEKYFSAELWGTLESAARDAVIVFYGVDRNKKGEIEDVDFNFVKRDIFNHTYHMV